MDWSFLANETCINVIYTRRRDRCAILTSNDQQFLSFRFENVAGCSDCPLVCFHYFCGCEQVDEFSKSIASHPSFGDVVESKMISKKNNLKSFSSLVFQIYFFYFFQKFRTLIKYTRGRILLWRRASWFISSYCNTGSLLFDLCTGRNSSRRTV
ncbi:unnamed protein product [Oikopleura dioica]|uniref:Uncharacterized protein n=1 Tax=Oikopleura dioica TaxID=34765 RepID=E4XKA6_OIKDI|nr:unnamed protein product [Oikopleura dioica]CBY42240.1 unnamed protein product [Oikopleura dioica]